jgi:hypothetical protein
MLRRPRDRAQRFLAAVIQLPQMTVSDHTADQLQRCRISYCGRICTVLVAKV